MSRIQPILLVDPGRQVPGYCRALATALARQLPEGGIHYATAPLLHYAEGALPGVTLEIAFSRFLLDRASRPPSAGARRLRKAVAYPLELHRFVRHALALRPSVLHLQWSLFPALEREAWRRLRRSGVPWVHTVHNVLPHEPRPWQAPQLRRLYASADQLVVHSAHARDRLEALLGETRPPIHVLEMPADPVPALGEGPEVRAAARARLGLGDAPLALFFGHVRPYKGLDLLLEAWPRVLDQMPRARLMIAGHVAGGSAAEDRLRRRLAGPEMRGSLRLDAGYVASDAVADHFAAADLVVAPYRDSDHSAVVTAARGYGRAVLATRVGGLPEALARGGGKLVAAEPGAIAVGLLELLGQRAEIARLEAEARRAARAWTWEDAARETLELHRRLRDERKERGAGERRGGRGADDEQGQQGERDERDGRDERSAP